MGRLYFSCPIQAAYMAKEFHVQFSQPISRFETFDGKPFEFVIGGIREIEKIYVSLESEAIFKPKLLDLGHHLDDAPVIYQREVNSGEMAWLGTGHFYGLYKDSEVEIIKREGKLFFSAKRETTSNN